MGQQYAMLTYRGWIEAPIIPMLLGFDETFRPYQVIDIEPMTGRPRNEPAAADWDEFGCPINPKCRMAEPHSHVYLSYAEADTMKEQGEMYTASLRARGLIP